MPGSKRYLQQLWWCSTSWVQGWDWLSRSQHRWAVDLTYSAHPVFVFPNHFLFCFYFLALSSFYKLHWLPLSTIEPVVFLLQSKSKLYMIPFILEIALQVRKEAGFCSLGQIGGLQIRKGLICHGIHIVILLICVYTNFHSQSTFTYLLLWNPQQHVRGIPIIRVATHPDLPGNNSW